MWFWYINAKYISASCKSGSHTAGSDGLPLYVSMQMGNFSILIPFALKHKIAVGSSILCTAFT
jgi:hypothetical protein